MQTPPRKCCEYFHLGDSVLYALPAGTWQLHSFCLPGLSLSTTPLHLQENLCQRLALLKVFILSVHVLFHLPPLWGSSWLFHLQITPPLQTNLPSLLEFFLQGRKAGGICWLAATGLKRVQHTSRASPLSTVLSFPLCPVLSKMLHRHEANLFWVLTQPNILYTEVNLHPSGRYSCANFLCDKLFVLA